MLSENLPLANIDGSKTNVDQLAHAEAHIILDPTKRLLILILGQTRQERNGHAVDVAAVARLGGVDVGVRVDPDDGDVAVEALARGLGRAGNGADGDAVVAAEGERHAALRRVLVRLLGDLAGDDGGVAGALHAAVVRVRLGDDVLVGLDGLVAVELVLELIAELVEEAGFEEDLGASIDTSFGLEITCISLSWVKP